MNGLAKVPFEGILIYVYNGTRRKYNDKFRHNGYTTSHYVQSFSLKLLIHGTVLVSPMLRDWLTLHLNFVN